MDYFIELKSICEEFNEYYPMPTCTCVYQCICFAMKNVQDYKHEDQVIQFLTGRND